MQFPLQDLPRREFREILGDPDTGSLQSQQPDLLLRLSDAEDQADGWLFIRVGLVFLKPAEVEFHLPFVGGPEPTQFQVNGHQPPQAAVLLF